MSINITNVAKNSLKFSVVGTLAAAIGIPANVYVTTVLSPEKYGIYGILVLWLTYAPLIGPGLLATARREIPALLGIDKVKEAQGVQNIAISGELLYMTLPFLAMIGASFFFSQPEMKYGLIAVGVTFIAMQLVNFWSGVIIIREFFGVVVKGNVILAIIIPVLTMATVNWLGIYSLILSPLIASLCTYIFFIKTRILKFHFVWNTLEVKRLLGIGIVLQLISLIYWGFRLVDRTIVASVLPLTDVGIYTAAAIFVTYAQVLPTDFSRILTPVFWKESATQGFADTYRIVVYIALATAMLIPCMQLLFYLVREILTQEYIASIPVFNILSYNIYLAMICTVPNLILTSRVANRQNVMLFVYLIGLVLNIGLSLLAIHLGWGIKGVALTTVIVQGLLAISTFCISHKYVFKKLQDSLSLYALVIIPFLVAIAFYFIHTFMSSAIENRLLFAIVSANIQIVVWSTLVYFVYREYISIDKVKTLLAKLLVKS